MAGGTTWRCGHARTPENTKPNASKGQCRQCYRAALNRYKQTEKGQQAARRRKVKQQLGVARVRVLHLEREAARLGVRELLETRP